MESNNPYLLTNCITLNLLNLISCMKPFYLLLPLCLLLACESAQENQRWIAQAPADSAYCQVNIAGQTITPNGRILTPYGKTVRTAPHPYGLTLSPDGQVAVTANSGTGPFSISVIRNLAGESPTIQQIPEGPKNDEGILESVFMGLAITPDNQFVYVAGGQANQIFKIDLTTGQKVDAIDCNQGNGGRDYSHGYIGDLVLSKDGQYLYAVDQIGFRIMVIETATKRIIQNVPTGRYPFGVCLSPDEQQVFVANVGVFEYKAILGTTPDNMQEQALDYPAFGYNTPEMKEGVEIDGKVVPGLGDPNVPESFSVWAFDREGDSLQVRAKVKTGFLVGEMVEGIPAVGGASPNSVVATDRYVFVSNGNNDCVSVIDLEKDTVIKNIPLVLDARMSRFRGGIPFGVALSPDQERLYVAASGFNAVAVIDVPKLEVMGYIPVGWFPSKVAVTPDGKQLIVANAKGYGSGPNGGSTFTMGPEGSNIGKLMKGSVSIIDIPDDASLKRLTQQVVANNYTFNKPDASQFAWRANNPIPLYPQAKESPIKYIVFISKENRTYDEVFGQLEKGKGEAALARYGRNASFSNDAETARVENCDIMVNHLALAKRFAISDNFYVDSDHSADGHRWLVNTYPNEWCETGVSASYGGKRSMRMDSKAPGNFAFVGASGAYYPEDYNEHGSIWDHFERNNISFFNFGFGTEMAGTLADSTMKYTGVKYMVNFPMPGPLYDRSSRQYPTYNMAIPDQFRVDQFLTEWEEKGWDDGKSLPQVLTILLPNDHGAGDRPWAGYPFRESYMMDNDLALGRLVEFFSQTPYWPEMAIFVTEDDSQNGVDHVDAHRSLLMLISPWAKRDHVSHQHLSFGSIFKTFWNILGIPYLNQYDAGATDMADLFADTPDLSPYKAMPLDERAFDPQKVLDPFDEQFDWKAVIESPDLDDPAYLLKESEKADLARK